MPNGQPPPRPAGTGTPGEPRGPAEWPSTRPAARAARWPRPRWPAALGTLLIVLALAGWVAWQNLRGDLHAPGADSSVPVTPELVARGSYLALAGNCAGCHTARGGAPYAGGRGIATPFGTVYAGNLTPDADTGLGAWSAGDFWRALHNGRSRDGRLLVPAFPYPHYTQVTRADADALFAWLRKLPAVAQANTAHTLRFPYDSSLALALWRALFFRPGEFQPRPEQSLEWNRGAYLVQGLGHCAACHAGRNLLGATRDDAALAGGEIPQQNWYAPSLSDPAQAGVAHWPRADVVALLQTGISPQASVLGPMADVVFRSTRHLQADDLQAMATYLQALPQQAVPPAAVREAPDPAVLAEGARLYERDCSDCHGRQGEGVPGAYPALAGNRTVTMDPPTNVLRVILAGGFPPTTAGNPQPHGMPPFQGRLSPAELAAVATSIRQSWGNRAPAVLPQDVLRLR